MSISTKSLERPASEKSGDLGPAAAGQPGDDGAPRPSAASLGTHGQSDSPVIDGIPWDDPQKEAQENGNGLVVEESKLANADREKGLRSARAEDDYESAQGHFDEAPAASAAVPLEEDDDGGDYDIDSDFGDDSGDGDLPATSAAADTSRAVPASLTTIDAGETEGAEGGDDNSEHFDREAEDDVESPLSYPPDTASGLEATAAGNEVTHATLEDESDYPPDIDHVDDGSHSSTSGSDIGSNDGSSGGTSSGGEENSSQSSQSSDAGGSKTSRRTSSGSSSGDLSISDSEDGNSTHDDSTASSPARAGAVVGSPPLEPGETVDEDENKSDDCSLGGGSKGSGNSSGSERTSKAIKSAQDVAQTDPPGPFREDKPQEMHGDGGGHTAVERTPEATTITSPDSAGFPSVETSQRIDAEATIEKTDQQEASPATTSMGYTNFDVLELASGVGAAEGMPDGAIDQDSGGRSIETSGGAVVDQTFTAEPEAAEAEVAKKGGVYQPNLDVIDTSVDVGDLHEKFSLMLTSSSSPPADGSEVDDVPQVASFENSSAHPSGSASNSVAANEEKHAGLLSHSPTDEHLSGSGGNMLTEVRPCIHIFEYLKLLST